MSAWERGESRSSPSPWMRLCNADPQDFIHLSRTTRTFLWKPAAVKNSLDCLCKKTPVSLPPSSRPSLFHKQQHAVPGRPAWSWCGALSAVLTQCDFNLGDSTKWLLSGEPWVKFGLGGAHGLIKPEGFVEVWAADVFATCDAFSLELSAGRLLFTGQHLFLFLLKESLVVI